MNRRSKVLRLSEIARARKYVRVLRLCGWSVNQIAEHLGVSRNSVTLFANGRQCPQVATLEKLRDLAFRTQKETQEAIAVLLRGGTK